MQLKIEKMACGGVREDCDGNRHSGGSGSQG